MIACVASWRTLSIAPRRPRHRNLFRQLRGIRAPLLSRGHHAQPEMRFERVEITVRVQQRVATFDTSCRDDRVNRLAHGYAEPAQFAKVFRRLDGYVLS